MLLDTYDVDDVFTDADTTFLDMEMGRNDTPMDFASRLMKSSLRFGGVYTKAQLLPILFGGLPENLRGVLREAWQCKVVSNVESTSSQDPDQCKNIRIALVRTYEKSSAR